MVSRTAPFPQLIAGFKSRPHASPWLRPRGLYPQRGSYPCRLTCCPSGPAYLPPRLSSPLPILPSPSQSTVVPLAAAAGGLRVSLRRFVRRIVCGSLVTTRSTDRSKDRLRFRGDDSLDGSLVGSFAVPWQRLARRIARRIVCGSADDSD